MEEKELTPDHDNQQTAGMVSITMLAVVGCLLFTNPEMTVFHQGISLM